MADLGTQLLALDAQLEIMIFAPRIPGGGSEERLTDRSSVRRYAARDLVPNFPAPALNVVTELRREAVAWRPDVVVSHTRFFLSSALAAYLAGSLRLPHLHVEHGSDPVQLDHFGYRVAASAYDRTLGRWVLRHADRVLGVSAASASFVEALSGRSAGVIRRGLDYEAIGAARPDKAVVAWAAGRTIVAYVGRLINSKGIADLLRAFAGQRDAALCIAGDGPEQRYVRAFVTQHQLGDRVLQLGAVEHRRALDLLAAADVVVNPSFSEGLPTNVLEAAGLGRTVLATDVGGTGEIAAPPAGVLVPPRRPDLLAAELAALLGDPARRESIGAAARQVTRERFCWERCASTFLAEARRLALK